MKNVNSVNPEFYFLGFSYVEFPLNPLSGWYVEQQIQTKGMNYLYIFNYYYNSNETDVIIIRWWNVDAVLTGDLNRRTIWLNPKNEMSPPALF